MSELLIGQDIETILIQYLTERFSVLGINASVSGTIKNGNHVRIVLTGNAPDRDVVIATPAVTFDCYGDDGIQATALALKTEAIIRATNNLRVADAVIYETRITSGLKNLPDTTTSKNCYRFTASIQTRLTSLI